MYMPMLAPYANMVSGSLASVGIVLGAGYEWWVEDQWSLGVLGRVQYAHLSWSGAGTEETDSVLAPGLLMSATFH